MPKNARDQFRALPPDFPGTEVIALPKGNAEEQYSCVSVYAAVPARAGPGGLVRVNLFASLLNVRSFIASAVIPVNFTGPVISASGILADAYSIYLQASRPELEGYIAVRADTCCAEPKVFVPVPLQNPVADLENPGMAALMLAPFAPWQVDTGRYEVRSEVTDPGGTVTLTPGQRVLSIWARAAGVAAQVIINLPDGTTNTVQIEPNEAMSLEPRGVLVAPAVIQFINVLHFAVETVR